MTEKNSQKSKKLNKMHEPQPRLQNSLSRDYIFSKPKTWRLTLKSTGRLDNNYSSNKFLNIYLFILFYFILFYFIFISFSRNRSCDFPEWVGKKSYEISYLAHSKTCSRGLLQRLFEFRLTWRRSLFFFSATHSLTRFFLSK